MPSKLQTLRKSLKQFQKVVPESVDKRPELMKSIGSFVDRHLGVLVALAALTIGYIEFQESRREFRETMKLQISSIDLQTKALRAQGAQFNQQEKRLQSQRYTELVNILWSVDDAGLATDVGKLRTAAVKEFIQLDGVHLGNSLAHARLEDTMLTGVVFSNKNLFAANLSKATLVGAKFKQAMLREAIFTKANLRWSILPEADLTGANLREADLRGADLSKAILVDADLIKANLRAANLRGANLNTKFITQPQLDIANGDTITKLPLHVKRPIHWK